MDALTALTREELKDLFSLLSEVEQQFENAPHKDAREGVRLLTEARDLLGGTLPGTYFGHCEVCGLPIGCDDEMASDEHGVTACGDCLRRMEDAAA